MTALTTIESTAARLRRSTRVAPAVDARRAHPRRRPRHRLDDDRLPRRRPRRCHRRLRRLGHRLRPGGRGQTHPTYPARRLRRRRPRRLGRSDAGGDPQPAGRSGILGVNTGASLAVVIGIAYFGLASATQYIWFAIIGAAITAVFVYTIGSLGRQGATPLKLALAGAATAAALTSFCISAVVLPRGDISDLARDWQIGGVGGVTIECGHPRRTVPPRRVPHLHLFGPRAQRPGPRRRTRRRTGQHVRA